MLNAKIFKMFGGNALKMACYPCHVIWNWFTKVR